MCKKLFRLYNIEYINDMVIALPELIFRVLRIIAYVQNASSSSNNYERFVIKLKICRSCTFR